MTRDAENSVDATRGPGRVQGTERQALEVLEALVRDTLGERRRARRWRIGLRVVTLLWVTGLLAWLLVPMRGVESMGEGGPHTALVRVEGMIGAGEPASAGPVIDALEEALGNEQVRGVLLAIDSPGGSAVQSDIIYSAIRRLRDAHPDIPVHAVIGDVAASGGYYIAAAADRIYANAASIVGSIGVRLDAFGATEAIERLGIERRLITAGEYKGMLDPFLPVQPEVYERVQSMLDGVHETFIEAVREGRGGRLDDDARLFSGLIWNGRQAVDEGLVDALGDTGSVAREVIGTARIVDYTRQPDLLERLASGVGVGLRSLLSGFGPELRF